MGPGLLEPTYHRCLARELDEQGIDFQSELKIPLRYKGEELGSSYRLDILVQGDIVVEVKAQAELSTVNDAQLLTYMELTGARLGLLINFHTPKLVDGVRRKIR